MVTFQLNRRWLAGMMIWAGACLVLTLSACTQSESETPPGTDSTPGTETSLSTEPAAAEPAVEGAAAEEAMAEEAVAHPAVQEEVDPFAAAMGPAGEPATDEPDPFVVPDGSPQELLEYVDGLRSIRPKNRDPVVTMEFNRTLGQTLVTAADKILAQKPTDEQAKDAVILVLTGLSMLESTGDAEARKRLQGLPEELTKAGLSKFVRITKSFALQDRLQRARGMQPEEVRKLIGEVDAFLAEGPPESEDVGLAMMAGMMAEGFGDPQWAAEVCKRLGTSVSKSEDKEIASMGAKLIGVGRRIGLVGSEMPLEGVTLEGEPLDWSKYKGKVVLVDFWATWCGPCIQEMPNIRRNYDAYHDRGFDVIGISVDRDRDALVSFVEEHKEPWIVLCDQDLAESETGEMMGDRYGIMNIPTMALIGADGKVVAMNTRGPQLGQQLEKLLGPIEEEKEEPPAAEEKP